MIQSGDVKAAQEAPRYRGRGPIIAPIITQAGPVAQLTTTAVGSADASRPAAST
jgi:hypothetical protein